MQKQTRHSDRYLNSDHDRHGPEHDEHVAHEHDGEAGSRHVHGWVNADLYQDRAGLRAVRISTAGMLIVADPIAGLAVTVVILVVACSTARSVVQRLLDAVDPWIVPQIMTTTRAVAGVEDMTTVRARWVGHTLHVTMNIEVDANLPLTRAHAIAEEIRHRLFESLPGLSEVLIHTDPRRHREECAPMARRPAKATAVAAR